MAAVQPPWFVMTCWSALYCTGSRHRGGVERSVLGCLGSRDSQVGASTGGIQGSPALHLQERYEPRSPFSDGYYVVGQLRGVLVNIKLGSASFGHLPWAREGIMYVFSYEDVERLRPRASWFVCISVGTYGSRVVRY